MCDLTHLTQGAECIRRCAERIFANHICGSVSKYSRTEGETSNICHSGASKSPRARHVGCARALPKVHHVICSVRLSPSVSLTRMSSRLVSPPCKTSPLLALLFRRQKKWHLLMANLCAWPPRNLNCASTVPGDCPSIPVTIRAPNTSLSGPISSVWDGPEWFIGLRALAVLQICIGIDTVLELNDWER